MPVGVFLFRNMSVVVFLENYFYLNLRNINKNVNNIKTKKAKKETNNKIYYLQ